MKAIKTAAFFLIIGVRCFAQDFWMKLNLPEDATLNALAGNSEGTVFAATSKGVYISFDNGHNWTNTEITNSAYRLIVDKEDRIFAAIYPNIHYSTNNFCDKTCFAKLFFVTCRKINEFLKRAFAKPAWAMDTG